MKKLIVLLCAAAVGFCAQAASVDWTTGAITGTNGALADDNNFDYGWTYSAVFSLYADNSGTKGDQIGTGINGTYDWGEITASIDGLETSTTYWIGAVITETTDGGVTTTMTIDPASFTTGASESFATALDFSAGTGFSGGVSPMSSASWGGGGGAPEPTSGLLLLVGAGLLGLRRKRA